MQENNRKKYPFFLAMLILLPVIVYIYILEPGQKSEKKLYSVILYQGGENEWNTLEAGIEQARADAGIMINYVYLEKSDTAEEEIRAIRKEMNSGTSGILLASVDSEELQQKLADEKITVPLVFVETGAGDAYPVIRADDYQMGKMLGKAILEESKLEDVPILILGEKMERDSVQLRYEGLTDVFKEAGKSDLLRNETGKKMTEILEVIKEVQQEKGKAVALDKYSTEQTAAVWEEYQNFSQKVKSRQAVYGIGNTLTTVNDLDNEKLTALVYQNEFSMGYQGIMALAEKRSSDWIRANIGISYHLVTKDTMYEEEHARLLFPNS